MDLTDPKSVILEVKRQLRAVPPGSAGPVLDLIDENGQVVRTILTHWNRATRGRRNFENQIEFEFRVADFDSNMAEDMALIRQLRETQTAADDTIFQLKRAVKPKAGESRIWTIYGIEPDFSSEAKFHAP